jgi:hypothetical protein
MKVATLKFDTIFFKIEPNPHRRAENGCSRINKKGISNAHGEAE